jgi:hypothetical protein
MRLYKIFSLSSSIIFFIVGFIFLLIPSRVLVFFNTLSGYFGMVPSPVIGLNFYVVLAVAYMYLAALLAFLMYRHPENMYFPLLLANGKLASSLLSLYIFSVHQPSLIFVVNCFVDGLIGIVASIFYFKIKKAAQ